MAHIKPGVITNNFMEKRDYLSEIERGTLYYETWKGGLLLLRRRRGFSRLNYYLTGPDVLPELPERETLVTEHVFRPGDDGKEIYDFLNRLGFEALFQRARFVREEDGGKVPEYDGGKVKNGGSGAETASAEDAEAHMSFWFPASVRKPAACRKETNCRRWRKRDATIRARDESGGIAGILHFKSAKETWEIRHLAVSEEMRGLGIAGGMAEMCFRLNVGKTGLVWARKDYAPAVGFYRNTGYRPDGWTSAVMRRSGTER